MKSFKLFMAVVIICMMIFISISILTYNKLDPSALNATGTLDVHNFFGNYGANISDNTLWRVSKKENQKEVLAPISELYDFFLFDGRIFWTQNARGSGGPLTAKGRINSFCQNNPGVQ